MPGEGKEGEKERESQPASTYERARDTASPPDRRRRRRDTYLSIYPNLNDSSEGKQNKAKETDVRPEVGGGGRDTGEARKGDVSWQAEQRQVART